MVLDAPETRKNPLRGQNPQEVPLTDFFSPGIYPALFYQISETPLEERFVGGESADGVRP